ncbi:MULTISPECIES: Lcl domain-containing protein [Vibrio]|uniref:Lcl domain-containing protein n=1 Tax=Vibrio TaxID=662 RepID=UPI000E8CBF88|nr:MULTISPECIES: DUF1566 domain-containing protein [Vibrio]HBV75904.1 DUF1566 domain-containing protein [Vibrio sp.]
MTLKLSILSAAILLAGCGGGSDGSSDVSEPTYQVSGQITALASQGDEKVCADLNGDFICGSNEPSTTARDGSFSITSHQKSILESPLVVELDIGTSSLSSYVGNKTNAFLVAPSQRKTTGNEINVITTLVASQMSNGLTLNDAINSIKIQLNSIGLTATNNLLNEGNSNQYQILEQNILTLIASIDKSNANFLLSILSSNLSDYQSFILAPAPTESAIQALIIALNKATEGKDFNDTGLVEYYSDNGSSFNAPSDYLGQDADYGHDKNSGGFLFTKLDFNGRPLKDEAEQWSCVKDQRTGLVWETKSDDLASPQFKDKLFAYQVSGKFEPYQEDIDMLSCSDEICTTEDYVNYLNKNTVCGINNWRLPTFGEFYDIIDFGIKEKDFNGDVYGLSPDYFPRQSIISDLASGEVWTSTEFFTEYEATKIPHSRVILAALTRGIYRGTTYPVNIYSDKVEVDMGASYQLPIRLVSEMESVK